MLYFQALIKDLKSIVFCNVCGRIVCCFYNDNMDFGIDKQ